MTVISVFAAGFATAPAAAVANPSADDLDVNAGTQTQQVSFTLEAGTDFDGTANGTSTTTFDVQAADSNLVLDGSAALNSATQGGGDVSGAVTVTDDGTSQVTVEVDEGAVASGSNVEILLDVPVDASGASRASGVAYTVTSDGGSAGGSTADAVFDVVRSEIDATADDPSPNGAGATATYATNVTVVNTSGGETVEYVSIAFGSNDVDLANVGADDVSVSLGGTSVDVAGVLTSADSGDVGANQLVIDVSGDPQTLGSDVADGDELTITVADVATGGASGDFQQTVGLHESGSAIGGVAAGAFVTGTDTYAVGERQGLTGDDFDRDVSGTETQVVFLGQVAYSGEFDAREDVQLRRVTGSGSSEFVREAPTNDYGEVTFDTGSLEPGQYFVRGPVGETTTDTAGFEVVEQTFSVSASSTTVDNAGDGATTSVTIDSNRGGQFDHVITSENLSVSELEDVTGGEAYDADDDGQADSVRVTAGDGDSLDLNFTGVDAGEYTLAFDVEDTTAADTVNVTVESIGEGQATFAEDTYVDQRGDVVAVTINLTEAAQGGAGTLIVGDEDDVGYEATVSFTDRDDDGQVTVRFNSYWAGGTTDQYTVSAAGDDTVSLEDRTELSGLLDAGEYELQVSTGDAAATADSPSDLAVIALEERSTDGVNLWIASDDNAAAVDSPDDVATAAEEGLITESDAVAAGDTIVHEVSASGLEGPIQGLIDQDNGVDTTTEAFERLVEDGLVTVDIEQTDDSTRANRDPKVVESFEIEGVVAAEDTYYVVTDTDSFETEGSNAVAAGDVYEVTFTVNDTWLLDGDDPQSASQEIEVVERTGSFDDDPVQVAADAEQQITGTSSIAPGSELTVRVRSSGDTEPRFVKTQSVTVQGDGTFAASFDFSDQQANDTFVARLRGGDFGTVEADGEVVEAQTATPTEADDTETPTEADDTPTEADDTPTEADGDTPTEMDTDTPTPTEGDTPGFGALAAVVALLAAALLAVRRR